MNGGAQDVKGGNVAPRTKWEGRGIKIEYIWYKLGLDHSGWRQYAKGQKEGKR